MKTTKKILLSLAACCVLFGLVGCGDKNTNPYEGMTDEEFYYAIFENATYVSDDETERKTILDASKTDTWYALALCENKVLNKYDATEGYGLYKLSNNVLYWANNNFEATAFSDYTCFYDVLSLEQGPNEFYWAELDSYAQEIINNRITYTE